MVQYIYTWPEYVSSTEVCMLSLEFCQSFNKFCNFQVLWVLQHLILLVPATEFILGFLLCSKTAQGQKRALCALFDTSMKLSTQIVLKFLAKFLEASWNLKGSFGWTPRNPSRPATAYRLVFLVFLFSWGITQHVKTWYEKKDLIKRINSVFFDVIRHYHSKVMVICISCKTKTSDSQFIVREFWKLHVGGRSFFIFHNMERCFIAARIKQ